MTEKELKAFSSVLTLAKMSLSTMVKTDDDKIKVSGLYDEWTEGNHAVGEIYTAKNQVWECFQAYDNSTYPDINPEILLGTLLIDHYMVKLRTLLCLDQCPQERMICTTQVSI